MPQLSDFSIYRTSTWNPIVVDLILKINEGN